MQTETKTLMGDRLNVLDLFSGIGGFSLGLERAGMRTVAFCEIDPFCRRVLAKHWPSVPCYDDVRTLPAVSADVVCGGFPCQDISSVGDRSGLGGNKSGLWAEFARIISEVRPQYIIVENVPGLLVRGIDCILADLAELGFDAEWDCLPAAHFGAPHLRLRAWLVAYTTSNRNRLAPIVFSTGRDFSQHCPGWATEPDVGRVAHGIPKRVDRLRSLGNAVVPQIPEIIGRAIMKARR